MSKESSLLDAIYNSDLETVRKLIGTQSDGSAPANINSTSGMSSPLVAAMHQMFLATGAGGQARLDRAKQIVYLLFNDPWLNVNACGTDQISPICFAIEHRQNDLISLLLTRGSDLFQVVQANLIVLDKLHMASDDVKRHVEQHIPFKTIDEIKHGLDQHREREAAYCFQYYFGESDISGTVTEMVFNRIMNWIIASGDIFLMKRYMILNVPAIDENNARNLCRALGDKLDAKGWVQFINTFPLNDIDNDFSNLRNYFCEYLVQEKCNKVLCDLLVAINSSINTVSFYQAKLSCMGFISFIWSDGRKKSELATWFDGLDDRTKCDLAQDLIDKRQFEILGYLFDQGAVNLSLVHEEGLNLFETAIVTGDVEACKFFLRRSTENIPYHLLLNNELNCPDEYLAGVREVFRLFCPYMPALAANEYVKLALIRGGLPIDNLMYDSLLMRLGSLAREESGGPELYKIDIICLGPILGDGGLGAESSAQSIQKISTELYGEAVDENVQSQKFRNQYTKVVHAVRDWAIANGCGSAEQYDTFLTNLYSALTQDDRDPTAYRFRMNYTNDVKRTLELILYQLAYVDNDVESLERKKACMRNFSEQIIVCGPGVRQAMQDCLLSLDIGDINKWLQQQKVEIVKQCMIEIFPEYATNTHVITWAMQFLSAQGRAMPMSLFTHVADELFDINNVVTPEHRVWIEEQLIKHYTERFNLTNILNIIVEHVQGLLSAHGSFVGDYSERPDLLNTLRSLGILEPGVSNLKHVLADIFTPDLFAKDMSKLREELSIYSGEDDSDLKKDWEFKTFLPGKRGQAASKDNYVHLLVGRDDRFTLEYCFDNGNSKGRVDVSDLTLGDGPIELTYRSIFPILNKVTNFFTDLNEDAIKFRALKGLEINHALDRYSFHEEHVDVRLPVVKVIDDEYNNLITMHSIDGLLHFYLLTLDANMEIAKVRALNTGEMSDIEFRGLLSCFEQTERNQAVHIPEELGEQFLSREWVRRFLPPDDDFDDSDLVVSSTNRPRRFM